MILFNVNIIKIVFIFDYFILNIINIFYFDIINYRNKRKNNISFISININININVVYNLINIIKIENKWCK